MISGSCHCGAVQIEVPEPPQSLLDCNCSLCRRNAALWAYYPPDAVRVIGHPQHTSEYVWGDRTLRTVRCSHCGCITHWEPLQPGLERVGVNMRNFDPAVIAAVPVRHFDGADTWEYLD
ncbi:GFA family protein [Lysobacter niastensis]|uniref:GFA family protein n=1 Tax=Lysobacter niastensis TaxID=380629 RepID=A0ABS0B6L5_9GAMM|nr:GFA family protein [Lysobacter niastensis]MBF6024673.1 GFA family protein [Lysobacter niastensis]